MKSLFFGFLLAITSSVIDITTGSSIVVPQQDPVKSWTTFKTQFGKKYKSPDEESNRNQIFGDNLQKIQAQNSLAANGQSGHTAGINQFSDMSLSEYSAQVNGYVRIKRSPNDPSLGVTQGVTNQPPLPTMTITTASSPTTPVQMINGYPASVDWRIQGYVTPVKNQGQCAGCWAFSSTGALEGQLFRKTGKLVSLSEQNLIDCAIKPTYANSGCNTGNMAYGFKYVKVNAGIDTEASYPYTAANGASCLYSTANIGATATSYTNVQIGNETALMQAVATIGPISIAVDANHVSFQTYSSGIYSEPNCTTAVNHAVLAVGYGTQNGTDYWIVKNSWGTSWGMNGYILMPRNKGNLCGIATDALYPNM